MIPTLDSAQKWKPEVLTEKAASVDSVGTDLDQAMTDISTLGCSDVYNLDYSDALPSAHDVSGQ